MPNMTISHRGNEINIELSEDALKLMNEIAKKRGRRLEDVIAEALRLERLLADDKLLVKSGDGFKELVSA